MARLEGGGARGAGRVLLALQRVQRELKALAGYLRGRRPRPLSGSRRAGARLSRAPDGRPGLLLFLLLHGLSRLQPPCNGNAEGVRSTACAPCHGPGPARRLSERLAPAPARPRRRARAVRAPARLLHGRGGVGREGLRRGDAQALRLARRRSRPARRHALASLRRSTTVCETPARSPSAPGARRGSKSTGARSPATAAHPLRVTRAVLSCNARTRFLSNEGIAG